jgi:serine/threonine protein kinase
MVPAQNNNNDTTMAEVTSAMDEIRIPGPVRPWDRIEKSGPPAAPIEFPPPRFERGRRDDVLVYDAHTRKHQVANSVLFRDYSREYGETPERALSRVEQAYWPIPFKKKIKTIMGHVEICYVLKRCAVDNSDDSLSDDDSEAADYDEEDDDVLFEITTQHVAVKVNYSRRMERYKGKHAENPLQEVAAMQLIGDSNRHVMGTIETLFDGSNLNVIMPYAGSGDLFEMLQESQERGQGFPEAEARYWFRQIMDGIRHLHGKGVCHRDLSPENVMIDNDNSLIIDMGMAIRVPYSDLNTNNNNNSAVTDIANGTEKRLIAPQGTCG